MSQETKKMGVVQLTIITAVNMMGSGIIMLPAKLASVGTMSILSWLVTAVGSMCLAYCFAQCSMFSREQGGMGGYADNAFGKAGNFICNYTYSFSLIIANVAIAISAVGYGTEFMDMKLSALGVGIAAIATLWVTAVLNFGGAGITGKIGSVTVWGVIIPVVGISLIGWFWFDPTLYINSWNPHGLPFMEGVSESITLTLWSFLGLESACANSDAVENPEKNVPIAVLGGTLGAAIVYIASTNVMAGIVPVDQLAASNAPFGFVFAHMFSPIVGKIVMGLMSLACIGSLLGWQFTTAQVLKSSSDVGYFPHVFSKVTRANAPVAGMIIMTIIETVIAFTTISPSLMEQFSAIVDLAVVTNLVPYVLSMAALPVILHKAGVSKQKQMTTYVVNLIATAYSFYALYACGEFALAYGGLVTFLGWTFYGFVAKRFEVGQTKEKMTATQV